MWALLAGLLLTVCWNMCTGADWCYQTQAVCGSHCKGPEHWHQVYETCGKNRQSPINIVTRKTKLDSRLTPFKFTGYQNSFSSTLQNNGHSVKLEVPPTATIAGGNLEGTYKAVQLHFHWGEDGGPGSEHTIDGEQYPMELHIVHMKEKYRAITEALQDPSGLAVLGFFYEESRSPNRKYEGLIQALKNVVKTSTGNSTAIHSISLASLIPTEANMTSYYRYDGSLTTPACNEIVVWTVFENPIPLSKEQLSAFSTLKFHEGTPMVKTFRPVQPRMGRTVYHSNSAVSMASLALLLLCVSMALGPSQLH